MVEIAVRAVLDTNVMVSGLLSGSGPPRGIIDAWLAAKFTLVTSLSLVQELSYVLSYPRIASRLRLSETELDAIIAALLSQAEIVAGAVALPGVTRDPKDDAVVACAVEGRADYIISGDDDLLTLGIYDGIKVMSPRQFSELLEALPE
jgi:uncharacterized protein